MFAGSLLRGGGYSYIAPVLCCYVPVKKLMITSHPLHTRGVKKFRSVKVTEKIGNY